MAETPKPPKPPVSAAARNKKIALIAGGVVVAIFVGLYLRSKLGSGSGASTTGASPTDSGAAGQGSGGPDLTPFEDLASALTGLTSVLGAGSVSDPFAGQTEAQASTQPTTAASPSAINANTAPVAPVARATAAPAEGTGAYATGQGILSGAAASAGSAPSGNIFSAGQAVVAGANNLSTAGQAVANGAATGGWLAPASSAPHPAVVATMGTPAQVKAGQDALNPKKPVATSTKKPLL